MITERDFETNDMQMIISICGEIEDISDLDTEHLFTGSSISF